jgi:hypothetical protein
LKSPRDFLHERRKILRGVAPRSSSTRVIFFADCASW